MKILSNPTTTITTAAQVIYWLSIRGLSEVSVGHCGSEALGAGSNWPHSNINTSLHGVELTPLETMWANQYNLT